MDYDAIVTQTLTLLQREQRLAYRVLKLRLQIDDDLLEVPARLLRKLESVPPGSSAASPPLRVPQPPPGKRRPAPPGAGAHPPTRPA